ncbi:hypothetical protein O181_108155 [Austropuccinia psidii MF-1]|uniref:Uncharacterized protein n=1 Tax=Austropuccinia psidii MF-1 TaxID=1389203 RepID=A0A9Q3JRT9_9BASI|nr:hypothetical protein [Austropuccinia psidii MF-1]
MKDVNKDTVPENQRGNFANVVLLFKALGINNLIGLDCLEPPPGDTLIRALDLLYALGALNGQVYSLQCHPHSPLPSSLKFKKHAPPPSHSSNYSDDVMVRTKPVSVHHQNHLNDDANIVTPIDVMVRTKPKIEHHEGNNNQTNHKKKLTQCQRQHIHVSKQIMPQLEHSNAA